MKGRRKTGFLRISMIIIAAVLLLIPLFSYTTLSLGIGPSRQIINFDSEKTIDGELLIINDAHEDFKAAVYPQGELSEYVTIQGPLVNVKAEDETRTVKYKIKFPKEPPKPGSHKLELVVRQFPADEEEEGTVVSATVALISQIIIKVPYPGKYAEAKLFISGADDLEKQALFTLMVYNFGTEPIKNAKAKIEIFGPTWEKIDEFETNNISLVSKQEGKIEASWKAKVNKGTYIAIVTVYYDDLQFKIEQNFDRGIFEIGIDDISVEKFRLGDVAKFDITLSNSWNQEMKDVYAEMAVEDQSSKTMTEFKTAATDILPQRTGKLEAYWYTEGVMPGIYKVKLTVHYAKKMTQKEYNFEVSTNSIKNLGLVGQAISETEQKDITTKGVIILLITIVLVLLIAMNIFWFYMLKKQIGKGGEHRKGD